MLKINYKFNKAKLKILEVSIEMKISSLNYEAL